MQDKKNFLKDADYNNYKFTEEQKNGIIGVMTNKDIYDAVRGLVNALIIDEQSNFQSMLRKTESNEKKLLDIERLCAKIEVYDKVLYYIETWRNTAMKKSKEG